MPSGLTDRSAYRGSPDYLEELMLILLALPVIAAVAAMHRNLQLCAPSNVLVRRVRAREPRWRIAAVLSALALALLVAMHTLGGLTADGAPGWVNLVVLLLAWDAIKVGWLAILVTLRHLGLAIRTRSAGPPRP